MGEDFPTNLLAFADLESIVLSQNTGIKNFPTKLKSLVNLKTFSIFEASINILPISLLNLGIESLNLVSSIDFSRPYSETNFDRINLLQNTLIHLIVRRCTEGNNIPETIAELYKLESLTISFPDSGLLEPKIYNLPNLKTFSLPSSSGTGPTSLNNFGFVTTLESLKFISSSNTTDLSGLSPCVNLKNIMIRGTSQNTIEKLRTFVDTLYILVTENASIGTGEGSFREMTIDCTSFNGTSPDGIFQAPAGYVQGSSNGTPESLREKIFVIVNQYDSTVNYTE